MARGHFVVTGLDGDTQLVQFAFAIEHASQDAVRNRTEVLITEFLSLRGWSTKQGAASIDQVRTGEEEVSVDQEVFLFRAAGSSDQAWVLVAEQLQDSLSLRIQALHRAEQRGLLVERFTGPRKECRWDAEGGSIGVIEDVGGARDVPRGVSASFKRGADAARWEAGCVWLTLDQRGSAEFGDRSTTSVRSQEAVVLFGGQTGQRIEDVSVVRGPFFDRPVLHGGRNGVSNRGIQWLTRLNRLEHGLEDTLWKPVLHHLQAEDVCPKQITSRGF